MAAPAPAYLLELRTVKSTVIKGLVDALKELLTDTEFQFDHTGLKILTVDATRAILVHLRLDAKEFEDYHCPKPVSLGIDILNLYKLIKTVGAKDDLTIFYDGDDPNHVGIKVDSKDKSTRTTYHLKLVEKDPSNPKVVPPTKFASVATMAASDFQKICRDAHAFSETMEIKLVQKRLVFGCVGDFCRQETVMCGRPGPPIEGESVEAARDGDDGADDEIVQGLFQTKQLVMFCKCANLGGGNVNIYLKNDYPIVTQWSVASLGTIELCLNPSTPKDVLSAGK